MPRLIQIMGLQAIYPKPRSTLRAAAHRNYPYLLRGVTIEQPDRVWTADITYIPMAQGFMNLMASLDWFSRYVITWQLSNTLTGLFRLEALETALKHQRPEIFNTGQRVRFMAKPSTHTLEKGKVRVSMDGRGRALDDVFFERPWRTVKYEHVYLMDYASVPDLEAGLETHFHFCSRARLHQSPGYHTPANVYLNGRSRLN